VSTAIAGEIRDIENDILKGECSKAIQKANEYSEGFFSNSTESKLRKADLKKSTKQLCEALKLISECERGNNPSCVTKIKPFILYGKRPYYFKQEHYLSDKFIQTVDDRYNQLKRNYDDKMELDEWGHFGVSSQEEMLGWKQSGLSKKDIEMWVRNGIAVKEYNKWKDTGIPSSEVKYFIENAISPDIAKLWIEFYRRNKQLDLGAWINSGIEADSAMNWLKVSNDPTIASDWNAKGFSAQESYKWKNASFEVGNTQYHHEFNPQEAFEWKSAGESIEDAARYGNFGLEESKVVRKGINKACRDNILDMDALFSNNPYDSKGKCYEMYIAHFQLLGKTSALFERADGVDSPPVKVSVTTGSIPTKELYGIFKASGVFKYKNALGVENITVNLVPVKILK